VYSRLKKSNFLSFFYFILFSNFFYFLIIFLDWPLLKLTKMRAADDYEDLYAVYRFKDCFANFGYNFTDKISHPDCAGFVYNYQLLKILNLDILSNISPQQFMIFQLTLYIGLFGYLYAFVAKSKATRILTYFLLLSPSSQLLLERGNFDAIMIALIVAASFMISKNKLVLAAITIVFGAMLKFYTLPLFLFVYQKAKNALTKSTVILSFLLAVYFSYREYSMLREKTLKTYCCSFGNEVFGLYLNRLGFTLNSVEVILFGWLMIIFSIFFVRSASYSKIATCVPTFKSYDSAHSSIFLPLMLIFSSLYFTGTNFDYKLQILSLAQLVYLNVCSDLSERRTHLVYCVLIQLFSYSSMELQPFGDLLIILYVSSLFLAMFRRNHLYLLKLKTIS